MNSPFTYLQHLTTQVGEQWNQFWFTPRSSRTLAYIRIVTGLLTLCYYLSWSGSLERWFGTRGLLPAESVQSFLRESNNHWYHFSVLNFDSSGGYLWSIYFLALVVTLLATVGCFTRFTTLLGYGALLTFIHRAPMITSSFETLLSMLWLYVCIGPSGEYYSWDAYRSAKQPPLPSWLANVATRLLQVHAAALVMLIACSMLSAGTWWNGTAMWAIASQSLSRPMDFTGMQESPLFVNAWTHAFVLINLIFPVAIWSPLLRPLVFTLFACAWLCMLPLTGQIFYIAALIAAVSAFILE